MKYILLLLMLSSLVACQSDRKKDSPKKDSPKVLEQPVIEKSSDPTSAPQNWSDEEVAVQFLNAYIAFAREGRSPAEIKAWLKQQENVSDEFPEQYIQFIEQQEFPDFDPILRSQDFPDAFIYKRKDGELIFLTGKDWDGYEWVVRVKDAQVIGSGVINVTNEATPMSFEDKKKSIRALYKEVNDNLDSYQLTEQDLNESTEGGTEKHYKNDSQIRKIEKEYLGEIGKRKIEYYFDEQGDLSFVFEKTTHYNAPIYVTQAEEGMEAFDPKKSRVEENRYYFYKEEMIEWLDKNKQAVDTNSPIFKEKEETFLSIEQEHQ